MTPATPTITEEYLLFHLKKRYFNMAKYGIKSGPVNTDKLWSIVDNDTKEVIASLHGSSSAVVAVAACDALNEGFKYDGCTQRLTELLVE